MDILTEQKIPNLSYMFNKVTVLKRVDAEEFASKLFLDLGFSVVKNKSVMGDNVGIPDFIMIRGEEKVYMEIKTNGDGLKYEQLQWIINNPDKKVVAFFLSQDIQEKKWKNKQEKLERKKEALENVQDEGREAIQNL